MFRNIWQTITKNKTDLDEFNTFWPDVMTFEINKFVYTNNPLKIQLTQQNIIRMDLLMNQYYKTTDYDDIILWLNNVACKEDLVAGQDFLLPEKQDIDRFYITYSL